MAGHAELQDALKWSQTLQVWWWRPEPCQWIRGLVLCEALTVEHRHLQLWLLVMLVSSRALSPSFWCTAALSSLRHAALIFRACVWSPSLLSLSFSLSFCMASSSRNSHSLFTYLIQENNPIISFFKTNTVWNPQATWQTKIITNSPRCSNLY